MGNKLKELFQEVGTLKFQRLRIAYSYLLILSKVSHLIDNVQEVTVCYVGFEGSGRIEALFKDKKPIFLPSDLIRLELIGVTETVF